MKLYHLSGINEKTKSIHGLILKEEYSPKEIEQLPWFEMTLYEWCKDIAELNLSNRNPL